VFYTYPIAVPANTAKADAQETELKLDHGVIHRLSIGFPSGCEGLAHVKLLVGLHQLWPTSSDEDFALDDHNLEWDDYFELKDTPYTLTAVAWNEDETYPHTITVRIGVLPLEVYWREGRSAALVTALAKAFGLAG